MNDDDYIWGAFNNRDMRFIYEALNGLKSKELSMPYYNSYNTRGDEVATALLEAYANGVEFETIIQKNSAVRQYWFQIQSEREDKIKRAAQVKFRRRKAAEKKKIEDAKRAEVVAKLTPEELAAFGLNKKGYHK